MRRPATSWHTPAILAAIHLVLALLVFDPAPYTGGDNAVYASLAESLLTRHAYLDIYQPDAPPNVNFPPVFPLLLAGAMAVGIRGWIGWKLLSLLLSAGAVAASYAWLRRATGRRVALAAGAVLAVSPGVLFWSNTVLSDVPFWALTMVALAAFETRGKIDGRRAAVGVLAVVVAYFTRGAGLPLAIAAAVWLAFHDRRRLLLLLVLLLPLAVAWGMRGAAQGGSYVEVAWLRNPYDTRAGVIGWSELPGRFADNARALALIRLPLLLTGDTWPPSVVAGLLMVVLAILRWVLRLRHPRVVDLFLPLYVGLLLIWPPAFSDDRFLLPILPILLGYGGHALLLLTRRLGTVPRRAVRLAAPALLLLLVLGNLVPRVSASLACTRLHMAGRRYVCLPPNWRDFYLVAEAARTYLPPDAVVLTRKPSLFYALSGHQSALYPFSADPDSLVAVAEHYHATFLVFDRLSGMMDRYLAPSVRAHADRFCARTDLSLPSTILLEIHPPSGKPMTQQPNEVNLPICGMEPPAR